MDPLKEFEWCFRILRTGFKFAQRDVFDERKFRFYFITLTFVFGEVCYISTAFDEYYSFNTRCYCLGAFVIVLQVSVICIQIGLWR